MSGNIQGKLFRGLTKRIRTTTSDFVIRFAAYYFSFGFWVWFTPKPMGGCHDNHA